MELIPVEPAALARADRAPVAPRCIRVGVPLAELPGRGEPHPVCVGGEVARVDGEVVTVLRDGDAKLRRDAIQAGVQQAPVSSELDGEAVHGVEARHVSEDALQAFVLADEFVGARPGGDRVQALGDAAADEGSDAVALAARPLNALQIEDERADLRGVEDRLEVFGDGAPGYTRTGQGGLVSLFRAPGRWNGAGALFAGFAGLILVGPSDGAA